MAVLKMFDQASDAMVLKHQSLPSQPTKLQRLNIVANEVPSASNSPNLNHGKLNCMMGQVDFHKNKTCHQVKKMQKELLGVYNQLVS